MIIVLAVLCGILSVPTWYLIYDTFFADRLRAWRRLSDQRRWETRPRAFIERVGNIFVDSFGVEHPTHFVLNGSHRIPEYTYGPNGEVAWGGYMKKELLEIARRREEFEP